MVNVARKRLLAVAVALCVAIAAIAGPAYAFYYVHSNDYDVQQDVNGVYEITCTVDATALGQAVWTDLIFIPANGTPANCLEQMVKSSESQNGLAAIHDYSYEAMKQFVADGSWTCVVYPAESQQPGTHVTRDDAGTQVTDLDSAVLQRYDNVVFTAQAA